MIMALWLCIRMSYIRAGQREMQTKQFKGKILQSAIYFQIVPKNIYIKQIKADRI